MSSFFGFTTRYTVAGLVLFTSSASPKSLAEVLRATTGSRKTPSFPRAIENTAERSFTARSRIVWASPCTKPSAAALP